MINSITAIELKEKMEEKKVTLVDCREQSEWDEGHISGATLLPLSNMEKNFSYLKGKENSPLVLQCRGGKRSMKACNLLAEKGFSRLYNLEGGITAWIKEGFAIQQ